jgi:RNA polymerase sigma factor (sigma-70 family)
MVVGPIDDETLLRRWQDGDAAAGAALFDRHHDALVRFFRNKVDDNHRDDLIQQTFLAAQAARFSGMSSLRTWLIAIAWRRLSDYFRAESRRLQRETAFGEFSVADMGQSPETRYIKRQERRWLLEGLRRIPLHQQVVLELHYWEGMSGSEIATALELPLGTVKTRLRDGRLRLERVLTQIAKSDQLLKSTLDDLEAWAARARSAAEASTPDDSE